MRALTHNLALVSGLSLGVALLVALASLAGLLFPAALYPAEDLRRAFLANDVVNLFLGLPILLGSMWLARRGRLMGLLFWTGALLYIAYNYIAYTVAMPLALPRVLGLALVIVSAYATYRLLASMDAAAVRERLAGRVSERFTGGVLIGFGALFFLMAAGKLASSLIGQTAAPRPELAVAVTDLLVTPAWVAGGILLWRRQAFGYVTGAGLLFQACMLFVGLLVFFILQPLLAGVPFPLQDFVVVAAMSLIGFIPLGLFLRGLVATESAPGVERRR